MITVTVIITGYRFTEEQEQRIKMG